jgi:hypothetical protein
MFGGQNIDIELDQGSDSVLNHVKHHPTYKKIKLVGVIISLILKKIPAI